MEARPIQTGKYRHRLDIEGLEGFTRPGNDVPVHNTVGHRWALLEPESGAEPWVAGQPQEERMHMVRHRYFPGLSSAHRYRWQGRVFNIVAVMNPGEQGGTTEQVVRCKEQIPAPAPGE